MAQHDYIINNQSGAAFRADLNNALAAIVSNNSGDNEPSITYAYQFWAEEDAGLLKVRNSANGDWITLFRLGNLGASIELENGAVGTPSLYFTDSGTDTGVYSPGTDQVGITTAGVQRVNFNGATEVVFNDGGNDVDFRIEGDTKANLFKVDAGTDTVSIDGITYPSADGTANDSIVTNGAGVLSFAARSRLVRSTVVTPAGIAATFAGIPSWVRRITLAFVGISTNGTANYLVRIGTSLGIEGTGYVSSSNRLQGGASYSNTNSTSGFVLYGNDASNALSGQLILTNYTGNNWVCTGLWDYSNTTGMTGMTAGYKTLSDTLERIDIATANGTDTFDSGSVSIIYEG